METKNPTRNYSMNNRSAAAARTGEKILDVTAGLWLRYPLTELTLERVAEESGVNIRTILRKFCSRDGLLEASMQHYATAHMSQRQLDVDGDILKALTILLDEYEMMGDAVFRTIQIQDDLAIAKKILEEGRRAHREWCGRVFQPYLPDAASSDYETFLLAFISATEVYLWKLLRRDLKLSYSQTRSIFLTTVEALVLKFNHKSKLP